MKKSIKSFEDLRPNAQIQCLLCNQNKQQKGSRKFRAHHVCFDCTVILDQPPATKEKTK